LIFPLGCSQHRISCLLKLVTLWCCVQTVIYAVCSLVWSPALQRSRSAEPHLNLAHWNCDESLILVLVFYWDRLLWEIIHSEFLCWSLHIITVHIRIEGGLIRVFLNAEGINQVSSIFFII
jgi:hypothetical protein